MRLAIILVGLIVASLADARPMMLTDEQVRESIIQQSVSDYLATGHPCACPYNADRAGHACGRRSAYSRPGGAAPICYPGDVSRGMIEDWRRTHP